ncbi:MULTISPECIES: DUF3549 family protein [Vibrio]|uniref:DUF3549 family protein n=1 Tax=Vibrio TaxID=662 RepID=UPI0004DD7FB7|nr:MULTISPECIES: DUF3549 family protein [Vibrio]KFA96420.1 hypothetical protein HW45_20910 [Vibrio sp. ER1A]NOI22319.1 DUF3549 family protein [Vibrio mediterranei]
MDTIHTLSDLLVNSGCEYHIYDISRRVQRIDNDQFANVEQASQPYPYPIQRQAQFAIAYWNAEKQPWIWFLKFNLDERGLLSQADVGQFLKFVMEAMGSRLSKEMSEEQQQKLANNPFTFKPKDDKLAVFHSVLRAELALPTSQYYTHAQEYFAGKLGWDNWQTVGLQGITDIAARLSTDDNSRLVRTSLRHIANEPRYALLGALEHIALPAKLSDTLFELAQKEAETEYADLFLLSAYVRALSGGKPEQLESLITTILASATLSHQEILIAIAGRSWLPLTTPALAEQFLIRLAQTGNQTLFNQLFADLVMMPSLRLVLLPLLHSSPSPELAQALVALQQSATQGRMH